MQKRGLRLWHRTDFFTPTPRQWLGEGAKGLWDPPSKRPLALMRNGLHRCKRGLGGAKDSWETFAPWAQKESERPFAPSPNHFWRLSFLGNVGPQRPNPNLPRGQICVTWRRFGYIFPYNLIRWVTFRLQKVQEAERKMKN